MIDTKTYKKDKWYAGQVRDDKSNLVGAMSVCEEIDIFSNQDFVQPEQVMSADTAVSGTELYAFATGKDGTNIDVAYGYGKVTADGKVYIAQVTTGGVSNPGAWALKVSCSDATNLAYAISPLIYFKTTEANPNCLYFLTAASTTIKLSRLELSAGSNLAVVGTLTQLNGSTDRVSIRKIFGELFIVNGKYISKVDKDGVFTEAAFTLPGGWIAVDIVEARDMAIILARNENSLANECKGFWWDLTKTEQFEDSFDIPMGGPQWIVSHKGAIRMLCAINGLGRIFQLSGAYIGASVIELPNILIENIGTETGTQPISPPKSVVVKDKILYFGLLKTDKSGIYALGQLDNDKPNALILSKRFIPSGTSDYAGHKPNALHVQGSNFYAAYYNSTTALLSRCETANSPARSSDAVIYTTWIDYDLPTADKQLVAVYPLTKRLSASTYLTISVASDYNESYTTVVRADSTNHNTTNSIYAKLNAKSFAGKKAFKYKIVFTSSSTSKVQFQGIAMELKVTDGNANF